MATFVFCCLSCGTVLDESAGLITCPVCGGKNITIGMEEFSDSTALNPFENHQRIEFEQALKDGRLAHARSMLPQLIKIGNQGPEWMFDRLISAYSAEYMRVNEKSLKEAFRQKDFTRIGSLIESFKEHDCDVTAFEQRYFSLCCSSLPPITGFEAKPSPDGRAIVDLSWDSVLRGEHKTYIVIRKQGASSPKNTSDGEVVFHGVSTRCSDDNIILGRVYSYSIFPCFRDVPNTTIRKVAKVRGVICYGHIMEFSATGSGIDNCAVVNLSWTMPTYDSSVDVSLTLERMHGSERKTINVTHCQGGCVDEDVKVGEAYRYELSLTIDGKNIAPVVREVMVAKLPDLPKVAASCYFQDGQYRLHVEWPTGVSEICVSAPGERQFRYTKDDFNARNIILPYGVSSRPVTIQAIQAFWKDNQIYGPKEEVRFVDSQRTLFVSIEPAYKSRLKFWQKPEWGMRLVSDDGSPLPEVQVSVENIGGAARTFSLPGCDIQAGVFFRFPETWGVKRGATIDVSIADGNGHAYIKYLTSQVIS